MSSSKPVVTNIEDTLEQHRTRLEASVGKLRKALRQWQTYSAEYEGFKEELQELPENASRESMIEAGYNLRGTVVDSVEVLSLLGDKLGIKRSRDQVIEATNHRITYVTDNISKVERQLETGEEKLAGLLVVQGPEVLTEDGEPIIEIREELDEEGNMISFTTQPHGQGKATDIDFNDLTQFQKYIENAADDAKTLSSLSQVKGQATIAARESPQEPEYSMRIHANDLGQGTGLGPESAQSVPVHEIRINEQSPKELDESTEVQASVLPEGSLDADDGPEVEEDVVIPDYRPMGGYIPSTGSAPREENFVLSVDEPPAAADLRRQMIDYNLHDISAVVAEIDLEEYDDDDDYNEYDDEGYDDDDDDDDEEEEDQYGRTTKRVITADIAREMQALQARIQERQEQDEAKPEAKVELPNAAQVVISHDQEEVPQRPKKKVVAFSEKLDVSIIPPQPKPNNDEYVLPPSPTLDDPDDAVPFLVDLLAREQMKEDLKNAGLNTAGVVVQDDGWKMKIKNELEAQSKKISRFKAARMNTKTGVEEKTTETTVDKAKALKSTILERQPSVSAYPAAPQPTLQDKPKKVSRFKSSKIAESGLPAPIFNSPSVGIHENTAGLKAMMEDELDVDDADRPLRPLIAPLIVEKSPTTINSSKDLPMAPSELDAALQRQEVAVEYFKTRNKMIQKEGGFLPREEEEMYVPLDDSRKKVSRFKAARLAGQPPPQ